MQQGLSEPEFHGDLVYKFRKNVGKTELSDQFKNIMRYKRIDFIVDVDSLHSLHKRYKRIGFIVDVDSLHRLYCRCTQSTYSLHVNFPFLDGDVPCSASYGVYISQLIRFPRVSSHVDGFNTRNKVLTAKLLRQEYKYHKLRKAFSKFYRRHFDIVSKYNVGLKRLLLQSLSELEFYGDLV